MWTLRIFNKATEFVKKLVLINHEKYFCELRLHCSKVPKYEETMKVLNVAEKNDAAKNIAYILGRGNCQRREGYSVYNKIYEFNVQLWNKNCTMIMTSVSGHLLTHEFTSSYRGWRNCHPSSLFDAPVIKTCPEDYSKIKKTLEREIRNCNSLIIWTDCDREGENIGFEIIEVCKAVKPNIQVYRAIFSEITQVSINRALQTLSTPNKRISDAVDVRSELDLRIGAAFTRFQTLRLRNVFPQSLADMLISYGSCQFPTLGFVVERYLAIERFVPEPYWKIKVMDVRDDLAVEFRWARHRLFEKLPCQVFLDICLENSEATVMKVTAKPKSKWRPVPLDTIELEKQGSRKLRLNAKETMKIAEKLYTQGFISYPRTETNIFPKEMNLVNLVTPHAEHPVWGGFASRLLQEGINPRQGKKSDQAHPPIHPTKYTTTLQGNEARVYEYIVRHFLACLSKNAEGYETIVDIDIAGEKFTTNGLQIIAKNYLEVFIYEKWNAKEIHLYEQGQKFRPSEIEMVEETTSPPSLLTEADLISLMDKHGIGTDATHAEHIDTIKARCYVGMQDDKHLIPGKLGIGLVMGYDDMGFQMSKPNLRAELERDLKLICEGQKDPKEVLANQIQKYREVFRIAIEQANLIDRALAKYLDEAPTAAQDMPASSMPNDIIVFKCPKCGSNMTLKDKKQTAGKFISCMGFPGCKNAIWFSNTIEDVEVLDECCQQCSIGMKKLKFKLQRHAFPQFGTSYTTCINCDTIFSECAGINKRSFQRTDATINGVQNTTNDSGYESLQRTGSSVRPSNVQNSNRSRTNNATNVSTTNRRQNANTSSFTNTIQSSTTSRSTNVTQNSNTSGRKNTNRNNSIASAIGLTNQHRNSYNQSTREQTDSNWNNAGNSTFHHTDTSESSRNNNVMCNCHENAVQLTVRKEGPNQGRLFYKCAKPAGAGCNFFLWASEDAVNTTSNNPSISSIHSNTNTNNSYSTQQWNQNSSSSTSWANQNTAQNSSWTNPGDSEQVLCGCGEPARKLTVQKDTPNKGRQFFACSKGMSAGCNFFQWADERNNDDSWQAGPSSSRGRGGGSGNAERRRAQPSGSKRKCGICGVEGHTRKTCQKNK